MEWIYLLTGLFGGALTGFLYGRLKQGDGTLGEKQAELSREHSALSERCRMLENEGGRLRDDLAEERALSRERDQELSRMRETAAVREQQLRQSGQQMQERERQFREQQEAYGHMQEQLTLQFQNIAGKLLEEKSRKFTELNKASLDTLLNPLRENIKSFEERVEKTYKAESDERNVLKGTVEQMMTLRSEEHTSELQSLMRISYAVF